MLVLQTPKRCQYGGTFRAHIVIKYGTFRVHKVIKCLNTLYVNDRLVLLGQYTDGREGVLDEAGRA